LENHREPLSPQPAQFGADPGKSPRVRLACQPVTTSPSLTDGAHLSAPSSPQIPFAPRPRVLAGHPSPPHATRRPMCSPVTLSRRVGCGGSWRPIAADLLPPVTALAGMPRRELDDEALCHLPRWPS
jgi:hypothetical protein